MSFRVDLTDEARFDLKRLYAFVLARELEREGGDFELADRMLEAMAKGLALLEWAPFICRESVDDARLRELVVPFGATGYVVLFEVAGSEQVNVVAVRHQREASRVR